MLLKITNTSDLLMMIIICKYEANNGTRGKGFWQESLARDVSPGLMMHHALRAGEYWCYYIYIWSYYLDRCSGR